MSKSPATPSESQIDESVAESFPASDPPALKLEGEAEVKQNPRNPRNPPERTE